MRKPSTLEPRNIKQEETIFSSFQIYIPNEYLQMYYFTVYREITEFLRYQGTTWKVWLRGPYLVKHGPAFRIRAHSFYVDKKHDRPSVSMVVSWSVKIMLGYVNKLESVR